MPFTAPKLAVALLAGLTMALAAAPPASAGLNQVSVMMDDDDLLYGTDADRDNSLNAMKLAGVDVIRATVLWKVLAPRKLRKRFDPRNPASYHSGIWNRFDRLVVGAQLRGMVPYFNVTWPGPTWGHAKTDNRRLKQLGTYRPRRREFAKFVEAVGRRYSGVYRDENDGRGLLPKVSIWSIGNEPNQGGWLTPQWTRDSESGRIVPVSPALYRNLYYSGRRALLKTGHDADAIMFGELAPIGRSDRKATSPIRPAHFLREMFCLDADERLYTGRSAELRGCRKKDRKPVRANLFGYHPYTSNRNPELRPHHHDEFNLANLKGLPSLLDRLARKTGMIAPDMRIWLTEFGYETNPPDRYHGISLAKQAEWINHGDFLAYRQGRVDAQTQFLLRDAKPFDRFKRNSKPYWLTYQSGILYQNGSPKPAWNAYAMPLHLQRVGSNVNVWGQVRFRANTPPHVAEVQFRADKTPNWVTLGTVTSNNPYGYFEKQFTPPGTGFFRTVWRDETGAARAFSREAFVKQGGEGL